MEYKESPTGWIQIVAHKDNIPHLIALLTVRMEQHKEELKAEESNKDVT